MSIRTKSGGSAAEFSERLQWMEEILHHLEVECILLQLLGCGVHDVLQDFIHQYPCGREWRV